LAGSKTASVLPSGARGQAGLAESNCRHFVEPAGRNCRRPQLSGVGARAISLPSAEAHSPEKPAPGIGESFSLPPVATSPSEWYSVVALHERPPCRQGKARPVTMLPWRKRTAQPRHRPRGHRCRPLRVHHGQGCFGRPGRVGRLGWPTLFPGDRRPGCLVLFLSTPPIPAITPTRSATPGGSRSDRSLSLLSLSGKSCLRKHSCWNRNVTNSGRCRCNPVWRWAAATSFKIFCAGMPCLRCPKMSPRMQETRRGRTGYHPGVTAE